jgi:hypothetical protein
VSDKGSISGIDLEQLKKNREAAMLVAARARRKVVWFWVAVLLAFLALVGVAIAVQLHVAYNIYGDSRCFWADCRIVKDCGADRVEIGGGQ